MSHVLVTGPHPHWVVEVGLWVKIPARTPTIKRNASLLEIQSYQKILKKLRSFTHSQCNRLHKQL
ncbi:hypothetical protein EHQ92_02200 [Leptospira biflexa]|nr:hypothetical protein EHQ89_09970 [Leptospira biflexa]TGM37217.1 hypothetical protein EHQ80_06350 [Leptospira biflexa]TGM46758.1 hypothetical protein EHQ92_02200 [Leptospira biflexa]TGM50777.1 hypothetical protein EHQ88_10885 [Leptospira biflexa]TGM56049.1 hypothetical protein EHQ91_14265 [Leptospira biflexa]